MIVVEQVPYQYYITTDRRDYYTYYTYKLVQAIGEK